jgi:hypothetical protein
MKRSIEDRLGTGLSPPLSKREVWILDVAGHGSVVVVRVEGRPEYPLEVEMKALPPRFVVREAGKKRWLTSDEASLRRRDIDAGRLRWRHVFTWILPALLLAGLGMLAFIEFSAARRPIVTGNGIVEYAIKWREPGTRWQSNTNDGSIAFLRNDNVIIESKSMRGFIRRVSDDEVHIAQYFELVASMDVASVALSRFKAADRVEIRIPLLRAVRERAVDGWLPLGGAVTLTLNSQYHVRIEIPSQTLESDLVVASDIGPALTAQIK